MVRMSKGHHQRRRLTLQQCSLPGILEEVRVHHRITTPYHPQVNGQVEVTNREVKSILEKTIRPDGKDWAHKLSNALWAYRTAYNTPLGGHPSGLSSAKPTIFTLSWSIAPIGQSKSSTYHWTKQGNIDISSFRSCKS